MNEERQAAVLIGIVALIGLGGLYLTGGIPFLEEPFPAGLFLGDVYVDPTSRMSLIRYSIFHILGRTT